MKPKRLRSLIGLELGRRRLTAVEVRRGHGDRLQVHKRLQAALSLDPLTAAPELCAREIKTLLTEAGIKGHHCLVCLPVGQVLVHQLEIPSIEEEDIEAFLQLEAERAFPFPPEDLMISISRFTGLGGEARATLGAIVDNHLRSLVDVLRAAGLRPVSITLGATALAETVKEKAEAIIAKTDTETQLMVATGGGLLALRALSESGSTADSESLPDGETLMREFRITLGRLPRSARMALGRMRVFGPTAARNMLVDALRPEVTGMGLPLESVGVDEQGRIVAGEGETYPAGVTLATTRWMQGAKPTFDFLPPRVSRLRQWSRRLVYQAGWWRLGTVGMAVALLVLAAFGWQYWRLNTLETQWSAIEPEVSSLETIRDKIRTYEPWYDEQARSLQIAAALTRALPQQGDVWMRYVEIENLKDVTCDGSARTKSDYTDMLQRLNDTPGVANLTVGATQGTNPLRFRFTFQWNAGESNGN